MPFSFFYLPEKSFTEKTFRLIHFNKNPSISTELKNILLSMLCLLSLK